MDGNMDDDQQLKTGNLTLERSEGRGAPDGRMARDRSGPRRHEPPDEWLERAMREVYASLKSTDGRGAYASRGIADAAHGITAPHRSIAKRIREAKRGKARAAFARRMGEVLVEYADRLFGKTDLDPTRAA